MAFPTTSVLDNFNRADENPLSGGGNWGGSTSVFAAATTNILKVSTNQAAGNFIGTNSSYWAASTFGPNCEAYVTIPTVAAVFSYVYARLVNTGTSSVNGYAVAADVLGGNIIAYRIDAGVLTSIKSAAQAWANGDSLGISVVGTTITLYYKAAAGAWTAVSTVTDSTYSAAGNIAAGTVGTSPRLDDFGGGTVVIGTDEMASARAVWTKQTLQPPRGEARMYVGTFEQTLFSFTTSTFPRGAIAPPTLIPRRNAGAVFQVKLAEAGSVGEQEFAWQAPVKNPGRPLTYNQPQSPHQRPVGLPPDPAADVSATRDVVTANAYRPFPPGKPAVNSFVPLMQGPAPSWVKSQWQPPPVLRGRESKAVYVADEPLPWASRWLSVGNRPGRVVVGRQSLAVNVQPVPTIAPSAFIVAPTKTMMYRGSRWTGALDFVSSGLQAIPLVTLVGKMRPLVGKQSRAALLEEPETIDLLESPAAFRTPPTWFKVARGPFTRIAWCPQTIFRADKDDRDSTGADGKNNSSTGGSGYNRNSTGVAANA